VRRPPTVTGVLAALVVVAVESAIAWFFLGSERTTDVVMLYLLGVVIVAMRFGHVPSLLAALLGTASFDFFFTTPYFSFAIDNAHSVFTCAILLFVAFVISNLTERNRRHALEASRAEIEVGHERLRNALLSSVSHDLRTPLAVVKGAATALLEGGDDLPAARRREYLTTISDEASRLNRLVRNLLDMTTLEAGTLRLRKELQSIEEVIGVALDRLEDRLAGRPVHLKVPPDLALVPMDATLIEQVLVNLLENATKHTPSGTAITVAARAASSGVEVEVADDGPGVPEGEEERVFDKFHRASLAAGIGLGLTICRGIVTAHGGAIRCANRPGGGASFAFTLPGGEPGSVRVLPEVDLSEADYESALNR
jgi:two-component system sensor histidine kinase KdpD